MADEFVDKVTQSKEEALKRTPLTSLVPLGAVVDQIPVPQVSLLQEDPGNLSSEEYQVLNNLGLPQNHQFSQGLIDDLASTINSNPVNLSFPSYRIPGQTPANSHSSVNGLSNPLFQSLYQRLNVPYSGKFLDSQWCIMHGDYMNSNTVSDSSVPLPPSEAPGSQVSTQYQPQSQKHPSSVSPASKRPAPSDQPEAKRVHTDINANEEPRAPEKSLQESRSRQIKLLTDYLEELVIAAGQVDGSELPSAGPLVRGYSSDEPLLSVPALRRLRSMLDVLDGHCLTVDDDLVETVRVVQNLFMRSFTAGAKAIDQDLVGQVEQYLSGSLKDYESINAALRITDNAVLTARVTFMLYGVLSEDSSSLRSEELMSLLVNYITQLITSLLLPLMAKSYPNGGAANKALNLAPVIQGTASILEMFTSLLTPTEANEYVFNRLEFLCTKIIFFTRPDNHDTLFSMSDIESLRIGAYSVICRLFEHSKERTSFLSELLSNLSQLVPAKKSSRQFRISGTKNIHIISALILQFIQIGGSAPLVSIGDGDVQSLVDDATDQSTKIASQFVQTFVSHLRDNNLQYRGLFELIIEDLVNVLGLPEWPASEQLLGSIVTWFKHLIEDPNPSIKVNSKFVTTALDSLVIIAKGVSAFKVDNYVDLADDGVSAVDVRHYSSYLGALYTALTAKANSNTLLRHTGDYHCVRFIKELLLASSKKEELSAEVDATLNTIKSSTYEQGILQNLLAYQQYFQYAPLPRYFEATIQCVCSTIEDRKSSVKSKAIKMLYDLIEIQSSIFVNPQVRASLERSLLDPFVRVREATIQIVGKYALTSETAAKTYYMILCDRANDAGTLVRKRAVGFFKDIYSLTSDVEIRREVILSLLWRLDDEEETISELAMSELLSIFFGNWPSECFGDPSSIQVQNARNQVVLPLSGVLTQIFAAYGSNSAKREKLRSRFVEFLRLALDPEKKEAPKHRQCALIMADVLITRTMEDISVDEQEDYLEILSLLARADGSLIHLNALKLLRRFLNEAVQEGKKHRLYTLVVFRYALFANKIQDTKFLGDVGNDMKKKLTVLSAIEVQEAVPCIWMTAVETNGEQACARILLSCISKLFSGAFSADSMSPQQEKSTRRLLHLVGTCSRYFEVDKYLDQFAKLQPKTPVDTVAKLVIAKELVFSPPQLPQSVRRAAIKAIGDTCIGNPRLFRLTPVVDLYTGVLEGDNYETSEVVMATLMEYFEQEEIRTEQEILKTKEQKAKKRASKEGGPVDLGSSYTNENAIVNTEVAQRYSPYVRKIALSTEESPALTATRFLEMVTRQGTSYPQTNVATIIALETSDKNDIALLAKSTHAKLHSKHESVVSNYYVEGLRLAAEQRKRRVGDRFAQDIGKLDNFFEVVKVSKGSSKAASAKKVIGSIVNSMKLDAMRATVDKVQSHLNYVVFLVRGLSSLNISESDELGELIDGIDQVVSGPGIVVDQYYNELLENADAQDDRDQWCIAGVLCLCFHLIHDLGQFLRRAYSMQNRAQGVNFQPKLNSDEYTAMNLDGYGIFEDNLDIQVNKRRCEVFSSVLERVVSEDHTEDVEDSQADNVTLSQPLL